MDLINAPGINNWDAINKQWREGVGGAQKLLPMRVVNEYCSGASFYPVSEFILPPKSSKPFDNLTTGQYENWFSSDSNWRHQSDLWNSSCP